MCRSDAVFIRSDLLFVERYSLGVKSVSFRSGDGIGLKKEQPKVGGRWFPLQLLFQRSRLLAFRLWAAVDEDVDVEVFW